MLRGIYLTSCERILVLCLTAKCVHGLSASVYLSYHPLEPTTKPFLIKNYIHL
jgi:hypothetical protein